MEKFEQTPQTAEIVTIPPAPGQTELITDGWSGANSANIIPPSPAVRLDGKTPISDGNYAFVANQIDEKVQ